VFHLFLCVLVLCNSRVMYDGVCCVLCCLGFVLCYLCGCVGLGGWSVLGVCKFLCLLLSLRCRCVFLGVCFFFSPERLCFSGRCGCSCVCFCVSRNVCMSVAVPLPVLVSFCLGRAFPGFGYFAVGLCGFPLSVLFVMWWLGTLSIVLSCFFG